MASVRHVAGAMVVLIACLGATVSGASSQESARPQSVQIPATATTLEGIPTVRIESTDRSTERRTVGAAEAAKNRLTIERVNGQFYWTSRGNQRLRLNSSGEFTYLSAEPGKYIRLTRINDTISYVEHVDSALGSVTWLGELKIAVGR